MQAIIMAAGKGARLAPLSGDKPKCFLEFGGRKIIDYQLALLERFGVNSIVVVTGYRHELIEEHLYGRDNIKTVYNPLYNSTNVITSFWLAMELLEKDVIYMHADTIFDLPIMEALVRAQGEIVLPVDIKACGQEEMKVQVNSENKITAISKNIPPRSALGEFIGVAKISAKALPELKDAIYGLINRKYFHAYFEEALQYLLNANNSLFSILDISGLFWNEIDFVADYGQAVKGFEHSCLKKLFLHSTITDSRE